MNLAVEKIYFLLKNELPNSNNLEINLYLIKVKWTKSSRK